ncbi:MAG: hypothetical protein ACUVX8_02255, partial [Candidatus Zipacnadales bacterium]
MDCKQLGDYGRIVRVMVGAATRMEVDKAVARIMEDKAWDFCAALLISASELGARQLITTLRKAKVYTPLAYAACMRRQIKRVQIQTKQAVLSRRVFRDIDTETDAKSIPDHIQAELDDLAAVAEESREIADRREAERDACPIRALIVNELAAEMLHSEEALDALLAIVKASPFEDTQHSAALKIVTNANALKCLEAAGRVDDLVAVGLSVQLDSAAQTIAQALT